MPVARRRADTTFFGRGGHPGAPPPNGQRVLGGSRLRSILVLGLAALVLASGILLPQSAAGPLGDAGDAVAAALDPGYMRGIIEDITAIGSSPLGFRTAGSPEDEATASYVVDQMTALHLDGVAIEKVPVDMWRFRGASLTVEAAGTAYRFDAASQGGVAGTGPEGLSGEIVFAGKGESADYDALAARGVSVQGKLVLANWDSDDVWTNHIAMEAIARGAKGTIITALPDVGDYYQAPHAIGSFDSVCDPVLCGPFITISKEDAQTILGLLASGTSVEGTMILNVEMELDVDGYNTIGFIRGDKYPDQYILFNGHHDAWFQGAIDCTSCVAGVLAIAKAVKDSGYQPARTLVFMTSTGEEWGSEDTYYDWLIGSYMRLTQTHTDWPTTAVALVNIEGSGFAGDPMTVDVNQEFRPFVMRMLGRFNGLTPYGVLVSEVFSWTELWTYVAGGVPGFTFSSSGDTFSRTIYHTDLDTIDKIDFGYLRQTVEFATRVFLELDKGALVPYDFSRRVTNLGARLDYGTMGALLGARDPTIKDVKDAYLRFKAASTSFGALKGSVPADRVAAVHTHVREAVRESLTAFTGLNDWDATIYPHEQLEMDAVHLGRAIDDLKAGDVKSGLRELEWWVAEAWYIPRMSYGPFTEEMDHHNASRADGTVHLGGPKAMMWGSQGHLAPYWNLWNAYMGVRDKAAAGDYDFSTEIQVLMDTRGAAIRLYGERLADIASALNSISAQLELAVGAAS